MCVCVCVCTYMYICCLLHAYKKKIIIVIVVLVLMLNSLLKMPNELYQGTSWVKSYIQLFWSRILPCNKDET